MLGAYCIGMYTVGGGTTSKTHSVSHEQSIELLNHYIIYIAGCADVGDPTFKNWAVYQTRGTQMGTNDTSPAETHEPEFNLQMEMPFTDCNKKKQRNERAAAHLNSFQKSSHPMHSPFPRFHRTPRIHSLASARLVQMYSDTNHVCLSFCFTHCS
jgi:hypothetical protein